MAQQTTKPRDLGRLEIMDQVTHIAAEWRIRQWIEGSGEAPSSIFDSVVPEALEEHLVAELGQPAVERFLEHMMQTELLLDAGQMFSLWQTTYQGAVCTWLRDRVDLPEYRKILAPLQAVRLKLEHGENRQLLLQLEQTVFRRRRKAKA